MMQSLAYYRKQALRASLTLMLATTSIGGPRF
jgi:hypothetical protein